MKDFQRLDIGDYSSSSRFARFFFKFPWNKNDIYNKVASETYDIRSRLCDYQVGLWDQLQKLSHVKKKSKTNKFCYSYLIQYPVGGGFMSCHREYYTKKKGAMFM